jgi:hypothetical protein
MPLTTWKIFARRPEEGTHRYVATYPRGRAPAVGEQIEIVVEERMVKWTVTDAVKDHSTRAGVEVFTVKVDEADRDAKAAEV